MDKRPTVKSNAIPAWLENVAIAIQERGLKGKTVEAEVDVKQLPKVVWNDETYYVRFDNKGASVYNDFANVVTEVKGAKTIADVNKALNDQVVTRKGGLQDDGFYAEIIKGLNRTAGEFDPEGTTPDANGNNENPVAPDPLMDSPSDTQIGTPAADSTPNSLQNQENQSQEDVGIQPAVNPVTMTAGLHKTVGELLGELDTEAASVEDDGEGPGDYILTKINQLETMLHSVQASLDHMALSNLAPIPQEYARHSLVEVGYPTNVMEQDHFKPEADEAAAEIAREDAMDLSTPAGRSDVFKRLVTDNAPTSYAEEVYEGQQDDTNPPVTMPQGAVPADDSTLTLTEENREEDEALRQHLQPADSATEDNKELSSGDKTQLIQELPVHDASVLQHGICPGCHSPRLTLAAGGHKDLRGIVCEACDGEYVLQLRAGRVFYKKGVTKHA